MCGFVSIVNLDGGPIDEPVLQKMTDVIAHRGPDGDGTFVHEDVGLGFRRLSILDLSDSGNQPMRSDDGRYVIVFNGEIYNYVELRSELESQGHQFRSTGDTEVLLKAFIEWGPKCVERFNGMWALAILDTKSRNLFVSRDRFGIKPLYWFRGNGVLLFASEIKSICASGYYTPTMDRSTAARFLLTGELEDTLDTFYVGIKKFPPGSTATIGLDRGLRPQSFWSLRNNPVDVVAEPGEQFAELFESAVKLRLRSDVPVGVLLSGGLDSTAIICSLARAKEQQPAEQREATAAFSYNDKDYDESQFVRDTIAQTGATLYSLSTDPTALWTDLDDLLSFHDEPAHSATALVGYKLMQLASDNGVKVVLNGQGADETLAGYPSFFENYWATLMLKGRFRRTWAELGRYSEHYGSQPRALMTDMLQSTVRYALSQLPWYRRLSRMRSRRRAVDSSWLSPDFLSALPFSDQGAPNWRLDDALGASVESFPMPLYLRVEDRNSMAHSVEARLPFLDYRLVRLAFSLPADWKMNGMLNKYVLREAMRDRIPESVRARTEKFGFPTPINRWVRDTMKSTFEDALSDSQLKRSGLFDVDRVRADFRRHQNGQVDVGAELFNVVQFQRWLQISGVSLA